MRVWPVTLALVLIAPFVGSFLGLVIERLPAGRPVVWGHSTCDACGERLRSLDLVPLATWLVRRGQCRCGEAKLSWFYPAIELAAIGVVLWAATETSGWLLFASTFLGWALLALAVIDHRHFYLPDVITLPLVPVGLVAIGLVNSDRLLDHAGGAGAGWLAFTGIALAYRRFRGREGLGMGDAKLLASAGAWLGWQALASVVVIGAALGLLIALAHALRGVNLAGATMMPFGPYLAAGFWLVWLYGPLVIG